MRALRGTCVGVTTMYTTTSNTIDASSCTTAFRVACCRAIAAFHDPETTLQLQRKANFGEKEKILIFSLWGGSRKPVLTEKLSRYKSLKEHAATIVARAPPQSSEG